MGFLLVQKLCMCLTKKAPVCCADKWWIAPIEGKTATMAWALEKFIMGCSKVIVVTEHQPLTGIFSDRDLSKVHNPCLFRHKEKYLRYSFSIQHCPGKWHKGADAISCNPVTTAEALICLCPTHPSSKDVHLLDNIDAAMMNISDNNAAITPDYIRALGQNDQS